MIFYFFNFITLYISKIIFEKQIRILIDSIFEDFKESITNDNKDELVKFIVKYEITNSIDGIITISNTIDNNVSNICNEIKNLLYKKLFEIIQK